MDDFESTEVYQSAGSLRDWWKWQQRRETCKGYMTNKEGGEPVEDIKSHTRDHLPDDHRFLGKGDWVAAETH